MGVDNNITIVDTGICNTVVYYPSESIFAVLAPRDTICTSISNNNGKYDMMAEQYYLVIILTTLMLGIFLFLMLKLTNKYRLDWYGLIALYLIGTLVFLIMTIFGPALKHGGFTRYVGLSMVLHNAAEYYMVLRLWLGESKISMISKLMILYGLFLGIPLIYMPLSMLFIAGLMQGGLADYSLVFTFLFCGVEIQNFQPKSISDDRVAAHAGAGKDTVQPQTQLQRTAHAAHGQRECKKYYLYGLFGAITHITTVQPILIGFANNYSIGILGIHSIVCSIPTYVLYIWFAVADSDIVFNFCEPSINSNSNGKFNYNISKTIEKTNCQHQHSELRMMQAININNRDEKISKTKTRKKNATEDEDENEYQAEMYNNFKQKEFHHNGMSMVLKNGLYSTINGKKMAIKVAVVSFCVVIPNALMFWFSPCFIDSSKYCD